MSVQVLLQGAGEPSVPLHSFVRAALPATVSWASGTADYTLSAAQNVAGAIYAGGTPGGDVNIIATPTAGRVFVLNNATGHNVTLKASGQTGVQVANGKSAIIWGNSAGTDFIRMTADA